MPFWPKRASTTAKARDAVDSKRSEAGSSPKSPGSTDGGELSGTAAVFPRPPAARRQSSSGHIDEKQEFHHMEALFKEMVTPAYHDADKKSLSWVNSLCEWLFPFGRESLANEMPNVIEDMIREKLPPDAGINMKVIKFDLGKTPPEFNDLKSYAYSPEGYDGIAVDFKMNWQCDCDIEIEASKSMMKTSLIVKHFSVKAEVCLILSPLVECLPVVGGAQVFMFSPPTVDWKFEGVGSFTDLPIVNSTIRSVVHEGFQKALVVPNRMFIPAPEISLMGGKVKMGNFDKDVASMRFPSPLAMFELGVVEAKELLAMDMNLMAAGTSDPYTIVRVGNDKGETPTIYKTLNPQWGDSGWMEFPIYDARQIVSLEVWDKDEISAHDFIGRLNGVTIGGVLKRPGEWWDIFPTSTAKEADPRQKPAGKVRLETKLYRLSHEKASLTRPSCKMTPSTAYMTMHIRGLRGLRDRLCSGTVLDIFVEGTTSAKSSQKSKKSRQRPMKGKLPACTVEAQRMLEFLVLQKGHSIARAAEISGIPVETVRTALQARTSFTCEWFQGFCFPFEDPSKAKVRIQMTTQVEAKELKAGKNFKLAELSEVFEVGKLIEMPEMTWEGFLRLERPGELDIEFGGREMQVAGIDVGPFDLEVKFQLMGFVPHDLQQLP
jgi:hypothetical protein